MLQFKWVWLTLLIIALALLTREFIVRHVFIDAHGNSLGGDTMTCLTCGRTMYVDEHNSFRCSHCVVRFAAQADPDQPDLPKPDMRKPGPAHPNE